VTLINLYSLSHFFIWFIAGRYIKMSWLLFLILSIGWEGLELILPFEFAEEWIGNKLADVAVNVMGFYLGNRFKTYSLNRAN
jgi:hypothetical protein